MSNSESRVLINGPYKTRNFGDVLLLEMIGKRVRSSGFRPVTPWLFPDVCGQLNVDSGCGAQDYASKTPLIFGGGGYIDNAGFRRSLKWFLPALSRYLQQVPYIIIGPGSDDSLPVGARILYRKLFDWSSHVTVRDIETMNVLRGIGVKNDINVTIDTAVAICWEDIPKSNIDRAKAIIGDSEVLCINVPLASEDLLFSIVQLVADIFRGDRAMHIVWLYENEPFNLPVLRLALDHFGLKSHSVVYHEQMWTYAALIGSAKAVFTTQLHVGIVAYALGVPACSYSFHSKTKRFYRQTGRMIWQKDRLDSDTASSCTSLLRDWFEMISAGHPEFYSIDSIALDQNKTLAMSNLVEVDKYLQQFS